MARFGCHPSVWITSGTPTKLSRSAAGLMRGMAGGFRRALVGFHAMRVIRLTDGHATPSALNICGSLRSHGFNP